MLKNVKLTCLAYATTKQVRHLLARSLTQRYAPALAGLTAGQRWRLLARIALGICHPAIPEAERHHLWVTVQHGHWQGTQKCKAQKCKKALCARCLQRGEHHEETVTHEVNDCPEARKVWAGIAKAWEAATGEALDTTTPRLTAFAQNLGPPRRSKPATGTRPPSQPGACCTRSPCDSSIRHAPGCTWRTTPRAAHTRPSGPRPGTSSAPSASASQAR